MWHNHDMPRERWYVTGLILGVLAICLAVLGVRWSMLAGRVPLKPLPTNLAAQAQPQEPDSAADHSSTAEPEPGAGQLELNSATAAQLKTLPGIGAVLAARIIDYRREHGPFRKVTELLAVDGIGEQKLAAVEDLLYVKPAE